MDAPVPPPRSSLVSYRDASDVLTTAIWAEAGRVDPVVPGDGTVQQLAVRPPEVALYAGLFAVPKWALSVVVVSCRVWVSHGNLVCLRRKTKVALCVSDSRAKESLYQEEKEHGKESEKYLGLAHLVVFGEAGSTGKSSQPPCAIPSVHGLLRSSYVQK